MTERGRRKEIGINEKLFMITYDFGNSAKTTHNKIISIIVEALYNRGFRKINYDHVKTFIRRENIPLEGAGRRWDIMIETGEDKYIAIEVKTLKGIEIKEEEEEKGGVRYICLNCGSYLWSNNEEEIKEFDELLKCNKLQCSICGSYMLHREEHGDSKKE